MTVPVERQLRNAEADLDLLMSRIRIVSRQVPNQLSAELGELHESLRLAHSRLATIRREVGMEGPAQETKT
jgi:hypothetical protein